MLDFGCSWGYGTYQLQQRGFDAVGFEISRPRAESMVAQSWECMLSTPARNLKSCPPRALILSSQITSWEHLPDIAKAFVTLARLLNRNGFVFHILPNFMGEKARSGYWLKWIGEDHPIAPAMPFFEFSIPRSGLKTPIFGSSLPFNDQTTQALIGIPGATLSTEGDELLVYAQRAAQ